MIARPATAIDDAPSPPVRGSWPVGDVTAVGAVVDVDVVVVVVVVVLVVAGGGFVATMLVGGADGGAVGGGGGSGTVSAMVVDVTTSTKRIVCEAAFGSACTAMMRPDDATASCW